MYIIDLAGSERAVNRVPFAGTLTTKHTSSVRVVSIVEQKMRLCCRQQADSKGHDKARTEETKAINLSLASLKECIRARTLASQPRAGTVEGGVGGVFVPYRRSKLTLLMKDVFDVGCPRLCSTVVVAHVSPLARDASHTADTLAYAAPLRVALSGPQPTLEVDPRDPVLWTSGQMSAWLARTAAEPDPEPADPIAAAAADAMRGGGLLNRPPPVLFPLDGAALCGGLNGQQVCCLAEPEVFARVQRQLPGPAGALLAKRLYARIWAAICDAKARKRHPDGRLVTEEEEAAAIAKADVAAAEKLALWAEREKTLNAEH
jgi:hypothetical protein